MSTFEFLTILAAFGGLLLSIINTIIILNNHFKKTILTLEVEKADIRCVDEGLYDFQINLIMTSKNADIFIRDVLLVAPSKDMFGSMFNSSDSLFLNIGIPLNKNDLLDINVSDFNERIRNLFAKDSATSIDIRDYHIPKDSQKSITFCDRIETFRWPDGYEDLNIKNWKIRVLHKDGVCEVEFDFSKHRTSLNSYIF